jgi:hypothetical protein
MSKDNLQRVLDTASDGDWKVAEAAWFRYQRITGTIAKKYGFGACIGAAVFAALSPNSDYLGNIRDTNRLLAAAGAGKGLDDFKVSSYGQNKLKAWRIARGEDALSLIVANKTRNFFLNIMDPTDPVPVTVDGHIFNAWMNRRMKLTDANMNLRNGDYEKVADDIRYIGADRKILPNVIQGLIWYAWKRMHRIRHSDQLCFWADDAIVAGLGFERDWF